MVVILIYLVLVLAKISANTSDEEYVDSVINMLLNGGEEESGEIIEKPVTGGLWKCGECTDIHESKLLYSEVYDDDEELLDASVNMQIGLTLPSMKCVTVRSDPAGAVRRIEGDCIGSTVILTVAPVSSFTINVYN